MMVMLLDSICCKGWEGMERKSKYVSNVVPIPRGYGKQKVSDEWIISSQQRL